MESVDRHLVSRAIGGDSEAFAALVESTQREIVAYFLARTQSVVDAEELGQQAFVRAYQSISGLQSPEAYYRWLYTIANRVWMSWLNTKKKRVEVEFSSDNAPVVEEHSPEAGFSATWLQTVSEDDRMLLTLRFEMDLNCKEIAERLGKSHDATRAQFSRLFRTLKSQYQTYLGSSHEQS